MADSKRTPSGQTVIEPEGEQGVMTRLVLMSKATSEVPDEQRPDEANVAWVLKQMVPKRARTSKTPPSIGSMRIPGKP